MSTAGSAARVSPVSAALRQAEAIPEMTRATIHEMQSAAAVSRNTTGLKSRVVLNGATPIVIVMDCEARAAMRHQSKAVALATIASPIAPALTPYETTAVAVVEIGRRIIWN